MKKVCFAILILCFSGLSVFSQKVKTDMPRTDVYSLDGKALDARSLLGDGPTIVNFWATWCKPCVRELGTLHDLLPEWIEEVDFTFVAVSVDDSRSQHRVLSFVKSRGWEFDVVLDPNSDLKRALNVSTVPHTFLFDRNGKLVWQHSGYNDGDEQVLYQELKKLSEVR